MSAVAPSSADHQLLEQLDFSGGWNYDDAPSELAPNESPDCLNMTLDERGGAVKRLGLEQLADTLAGAGQEFFYWKSEQLLVWQIGAAVYAGSSFATATLIKTFSTSDRGGFADFLSKLVFVHPQDGVFVYSSSDGVLQSAGGANNMEYVKGDRVLVWQNACIVIGDRRYKARMWRSAFGDPMSWDVSATGNWADIRDVDDGILVAGGAQGGQDLAGHPGLLIAKEDSLYRINDADTLAYTTLHTKAGAAGGLALTDMLGLTVMVNRYGIWATDGVSEPKLVSAKIDRLFRQDQLDFAQLHLAAAGVKDDRIVFSLPRIVDGATPTGNNFTLEYHPIDGWIVPHDFGCAAYAVYGKSAKSLYGLSPTAGVALDVFKGGNDDGADIAARFQTKWFEPARGVKCRGRRLRIKHRGAFDLYVKRDYSLGQGDLTAIASGSGAARWNVDTWNSGAVWGPSGYEAISDVWSLGVAEAFSFVFQHTEGTSATGPKLLGDGAAPEVGKFAVYGFVFDHIPLGLA